ncbi:MAG: NusA-like transcription termination signal-binding factor [Candidatus Hadarchaeales archaeon]
MIKLTSEELKYMGLFERITGAAAKDCVIDDVSQSLVTFVVDRDKISEAIGKRGSKIKLLGKMLGKDVEVVAFSEDQVEMVKNALAPAKVQEVQIVEKNGKTIAIVYIDLENRNKAVGKGGRRIRNAKKIVRRHCGIEDIVISHEKLQGLEEAATR